MRDIFLPCIWAGRNNYRLGLFDFLPRIRDRAPGLELELELGMDGDNLGVVVVDGGSWKSIV